MVYIIPLSSIGEILKPKIILGGTLKIDSFEYCLNEALCFVELLFSPLMGIFC